MSLLIIVFTVHFNFHVIESSPFLFQGHELAVNILYHLHSAMVSDDEQYKKSSSADVYEKFLLSIVSNRAIKSFPWSSLPNTGKK